MEMQEWKNEQINEVEREREVLAREKEEIRKMRDSIEIERKLEAGSEAEAFLARIK